MNLSGWIVMILSVGSVTFLTVWSIGRVLGESKKNKLDKLTSPAEIEPKDKEE